MCPSYSSLYKALFLVFILNNQNHAKADSCKLCVGSNSIPQPNNIASPDGTTCVLLALEAMFTDATDDLCIDHFQYLGFSKCGCPVPSLPSSQNVNPTCHLCQNSVSTDTPFSEFDASTGTSCDNAERYLLNFNPRAELCTQFQTQGALNCGCPEATSSPTASDLDNDEPTGAEHEETTAKSVDHNSFGIGMGVGCSAAVLIVGGMCIKRKGQLSRKAVGEENEVTFDYPNAMSDISDLEYENCDLPFEVENNKTRSDKRKSMDIEIIQSERMRSKKSNKYYDRVFKMEESVGCFALPVVLSSGDGKSEAGTSSGYHSDVELVLKPEEEAPFDEPTRRDWLASGIEL